VPRAKTQATDYLEIPSAGGSCSTVIRFQRTRSHGVNKALDVTTFRDVPWRRFVVSLDARCIIGKLDPGEVPSLHLPDTGLPAIWGFGHRRVHVHLVGFSVGKGTDVGVVSLLLESARTFPL